MRHNETANIWTHLIPAVMVILLLFQIIFMKELFIKPKIRIDENIPRIPIYIINLFGLSSMVSSTIFHTFYPMNYKYTTFLHKGDLLGILLMMFGSFFASAFYTFYFNKPFWYFYLTSICVFNLASIFIIINPRFMERKYDLLKIVIFATTGICSALGHLH